jgi:hypothetical protein
VNLSISLTLFAGLVGAVSVDLAIRYFAFGHLESIAIDTALFTSAYSAGRALDLWGPHLTPQLTHWAIRTAISLFVLIVLTTVHAVFRRRLDDQVRDLLSTLKPKTKSDAGVAQLEAAKKVVIRAVLLTFEVRSGDKVARQGKLAWRKDVAEFVNTLTPKGAQDIRQSQLLLPSSQRLPLMLFFGVGLVVTLLSATLSF